jgi:hypothetical protein
MFTRTERDGFKTVNSFEGLGKVLIFLGLILVVLGGVLVLLPKIPWIGKLPGDIFFKGERVTFYFPITTCIIVSIVLTLLFALFRR